MPSSTHFATQTRMPLPGSDRAPFEPLAHQQHVASATRHKHAAITVSVLLKRTQPLPPAAPETRMTREQFAAAHGAAPASLTAMHAFAGEFGLKVATGPGTRTLHLTGTAAELEKAFGVTFDMNAHGIEGLRTRTGSIMLPADLIPMVDAVLGLDNRPQATPKFRRAKPNAANTSYTPVQVAELYHYPASPSAKGQTIGLVELGGGFVPADITAYFATLSLPAPAVTAVLVDSATNTPDGANGADGEVMLDIEVCGAVAPGAAIAVYFAPNTDQGFVDAVTAAVHDTTHTPSVISISWGGPESTYTKQALTALDSACQAAAALGITITVASGDNGSTDGVKSGKHVDFPASSPHVLACGGTKLTGTGTTISSEVVWNETTAGEGATGGGVSVDFPLPTFQKNANVPAPSVKAGGRGVPDVAGNADPATGYTIRVDGQTEVIGGTSAVAPLWAGLIALANAQHGTTAGFINPLLYAAPTAFHDITSGNNGAFKAAKGWDACTGLGSPIGTAIIAALTPRK